MHAVVTGATSGIGEAIAQRLARAGAAVTLVGRDHRRLRAARDRIAAATAGGDLAVERTDLAELAEVRELADRLLAGRPVDAVISNAGVVAPLDSVNSAGLPKTVVVNYLAPYLLLRALAVNPTRIVLVATDPTLMAEPAALDDICLDDPARWGSPDTLWPYHAYLHAKTLSTMFVTALARRSPDSAVNGCHPGMIAGTGLGREVPGLAEVILRAYDEGTLPQPSVLRQSPPSTTSPGPDAGADTPAWLADSPDVDGLTGGFYAERALVPVATHVTDPDRCERLWRDSAALVGLSA